eukprot:TRINITY_DN15365_c0_g1_i1.p2 TRINITY_DN15365_c0_g1~~TRINITY_DN15365_c0_g1_i1.p2  ORF type:complete len:174 (+),score=32.77 TRINITY_DN15365_c0_g1_i1:99-620(+)
MLFFFFNDAAPTEIYTILFVGSVRCVQETGTWLSGGGRILRDYVYVKDLCRIIEKLLMEPRSGLFNVVTGNSQTLYDIAIVVSKALGIPPQIVFADANEGRGNNLVYDNSALMKRIPDFRFTSLKEAVAACVKAYCQASPQILNESQMFFVGVQVIQQKFVFGVGHTVVGAIH